MRFFIVSAAIVIAVTSVGTVSAFAPSLLIQGTTKCSSGGGGLIFLNAATLDTAAEVEETKMIAVGSTNGDTTVTGLTSTAAAAAVEKAWPVMSDNFVKDSDRVLP
jgi:hypothetical protein